MSGTIEKKQKKNEVAGTGGTLGTASDFSALMKTMQSELGGLFDRLAKQWPASIADLSRNGTWGLDVDDKEDCIVLRAEAPGFEPGDVDLRVSGDRLVLRASRKSESTEKEGKSRTEHRFYESMILPPGIDTEKIDAKYDKGVLTVTLPKTSEGRGKKIEIKNP